MEDYFAQDRLGSSIPQYVFPTPRLLQNRARPMIGVLGIGLVQFYVFGDFLPGK
jgi:hypothetical protein